MSIEEEIFYQDEFWGEAPEIPDVYPPSLFGCQRQWEATVDEIVIEKPSQRPKFYEDLETGFI